MDQVSWQTLSSDTDALLARAEAGESITIIMEGRPVAVLAPAPRRPRWMAREEFLRRFVGDDPQEGSAPGS